MFGHFLGAVSRPPLVVVGKAKKTKVSGTKKRNSIKKSEFEKRQKNTTTEQHTLRTNNVTTGKNRFSVKFYKTQNGYRKETESQDKNGYKKETGNQENAKRRHILHTTKGKMRTARKRNLLLNIHHKNKNQTKDKTKIDNLSKRTMALPNMRYRTKFIPLHRDKHIQSYKEANFRYRKQKHKDKD